VLAAVLLGLGLMGLAPSAAHAQANTFTVNSTADTDPPDDMVGDGVCDTGETTGDGEPECTLRAALEEAQNNTAVDTVRFDDIPTGGIIGGDFAIISVTAENDELLLGGIDDGVFIDGTTAPGYPSDLGGPIVGIDATDLPDDVDQGRALKGLEEGSLSDFVPAPAIEETAVDEDALPEAAEVRMGGIDLNKDHDLGDELVESVVDADLPTETEVDVDPEALAEELDLDPVETDGGSDS